MKEAEYTFCMKQFKPAIAGLAVLIVIVLGWTGWHCAREKVNRANLLFVGGVTPAAAAIQPAASPIGVKDKMLHPYWGNCNKCHVTTNAGKPISKVMAAAAISIKNKMPHKYWGNCLLCHKVTDGFQAPGAAPWARAAALNRFSSQSLGLKTLTVTVAMMQKFGLANEDGVFVLAVTPNSPAFLAGFRKGDEIIRVGKTRTESVGSFEAAINRIKPGKRVKINIYRGKKNRNLMLRTPRSGGGAATQAAATAPMTQNRIETLAEQLGVPKTQQDVTRALRKQGRPVANLYYGKVAVASTGSGLGSQVSPVFGSSPYFIIYDPQQSNYRVVANPNANDPASRGIQTGQYVVDQGVSSVIAGNLRPSAVNTLHVLRVNVYAGVTGTARDALSTYLAGGLSPMNADPNQRSAGPQINVHAGGVPQGQPIF